MSAMDKMELRITKDQVDMITHALNLARDDALSAMHKQEYQKLRDWLRYRRIKRWGDEYKEHVIAELTPVNSIFPFQHEGKTYYSASKCPECGVPFSMQSPNCPRRIFDRHIRG